MLFLQCLLTTAIFLIAFVVAFDVHQLIRTRMTLLQRVRAAVRYGALCGGDATAVRNMVFYGQSFTPAHKPDVDFSATKVDIRRERLSGSQERLVVTVADYPIPVLSPFVGRKAAGGPISAAVIFEGAQLAS